MDIHSFLNRLATARLPANCHNPYQYGTSHSAGRRQNLQQYLQFVAAQSPSHMLVGEAPGYRGARLTGIPFVSPALLLDTAVAPNLFSKEVGFQTIDEWPQIQREATATMMWQIIANMRPLPLLWNAFPFHPHQPGIPQSNRAPTKAELCLGFPFLQQLHAFFGRPQLVAVGNKAADSLTAEGLEFTKVRHPSHGGKKSFAPVCTSCRADRPRSRWCPSNCHCYYLY